MVSPWVYDNSDGLGNDISFTVTYDNTTKVITGCTVFRTPTNPISRIFFGVGPDGTPQTSPQIFAVPAGTTVVTQAQMAAHGFTTMADVLAGQVTAAP